MHVPWKCTPVVLSCLTAQVADAIMEHTGARGAIVMIEAEHMCMSMRGVSKPGTKTVTVAKRGEYTTDSSLVTEFFAMVR